MNWRERRVLTCCRTYLMDNVYSAVPLLDDFIEAGLIDCDVAEEISVRPTRLAQKQALVNMLDSWGPRAFSVFLKSLERNKYEFVVSHLQNELERLKREGSAATNFPSSGSSPEVPPWMSESLGSVIVSERLLHLVAGELPPDKLFVLGVLLGNSQAKLEQYQWRHPYAPSLQLSTMLCDWRASLGAQATVERLVGALRQASVAEETYRDTILEELGVSGQSRGELIHRMDTYTSTTTGNNEQWV